MDLGEVRGKMARKNYEHINAIKTVNGYGFKNVGKPLDNGILLTERKFYFDAYCSFHNFFGPLTFF